ncbi:MAG: FGGY family carbohydrate kinase, partial [Candidatus Thermoplasmatota archaeon]|nr:FGGY family carbohydrate kinase [Candidatus Thermoplasmatota archaeon]
MPLILAIDQGTTATKALAVDQDRTIVARAAQPTPLHHPEPGWAENDPGEVLDATAQAVQDVLDQVDPGEIQAIGITNQRETTAAWSPAGDPLGPAVSWQCRRTEPLCQRLRERDGTVELVRARTGLVIDPYFSATKMAWLLANVKAVEQAEQRGELLFGTMDTLLIHALTGEHATDPSNASRTMAYDIHAGAWDGELLSLMDLPAEALPEVCPSSGTFGTVTPDTPLGARLPELQGIPITGVAGDQQASLFGHGCLTPGEATGTLGTGAFFLVNTGQDALEPKQGVLATVAWDLGDGPTYALEGAAFACGSALEWATDIG